jgi:hypothetical protein
MDKINHNELQVNSTTSIVIAALGGNKEYQVWNWTYTLHNNEQHNYNDFTLFCLFGSMNISYRCHCGALLALKKILSLQVHSESLIWFKYFPQDFERVNKWVSKEVSEWYNEWVCEWVGGFSFMSMLQHTCTWISFKTKHPFSNPRYNHINLYACQTVKRTDGHVWSKTVMLNTHKIYGNIWQCLTLYIGMSIKS